VPLEDLNVTDSMSKDDAPPLMSSMVLPFDDIVINVVFMEKPIVYRGKSLLFGGIIARNTIYVIDSNFKVITRADVKKSNRRYHLLNGFWYGYLFITWDQCHIYYITMDGGVHHLSTFENSQTGQNYVLGVFLDRIVLGNKTTLPILQRKDSKTQKIPMIVKNRPVLMMQPLLMGILAMKAAVPDFVVEEQIVKSLLLYLDTPQMSSALLEYLKKYVAAL
jgi:hypothetical protein